MPSAELKLTGTRDQAIDAIVAALPKESIVRDEDDGVGRFAGERVLLIVGHARERLLLFRGSWGTLKARLEKPQLEVAFGRRDDTVSATLTQEPPQPPTIGSHVTNLASQMITIGAVVVAYHMFQSIPVDYGKVAIIAAVGAVAWSLIGHFVPKKPDRGLEGLVRDALAPMVIKKKKQVDEPLAEAAKADDSAAPPAG